MHWVDIASLLHPSVITYVARPLIILGFHSPGVLMALKGLYTLERPVAPLFLQFNVSNDWSEILGPWHC